MSRSNVVGYVFAKSRYRIQEQVRDVETLKRSRFPFGKFISEPLRNSRDRRLRHVVTGFEAWRVCDLWAVVLDNSHRRIDSG